MKRNLYFIVSLILTVLSYSAHAQIITTYAGNGSPGSSGDGGPATAAKLTAPWSVATDGAGNLYICDYSNHKIRRVDIYGVITTFAGIGSPGYSGDGGPASTAQLSYPYAVASDFSGNVYISDYNNSRIRKVNTSGIITTIAGTGVPGYSGDGGPATAAKVWTPYGLAVDNYNNVYIGDWGNFRVRKIDGTTGIINTYAGNGVNTFSGDGGPATAASIGYVWGMATDPWGNLYFSDYFGSRIRRVDNTTKIINTYAGTGSNGFGGDGGPATAATFYYPYGIASDFYGGIYVGDYFNQRVRKIDYGSTIVHTLAGNGTPSFSGDGGPATAATLRYPLGVTVDGSTNVFIADYQNIRVRVINGRNRPPFFTATTSPTLTVCSNATDSVNIPMQIVDSDFWQTEQFINYWGPFHGIVHLGLRPSNGDTLNPHGFWYEPTSGFSGWDTIYCRIFDGYNADSQVIYVHILGAPAPITGSTTMCIGGSVTLSESVSGGVWSSSNTSVATVGTGGVVSGLSAGTAAISYKLVSTGCYEIATILVNPPPLPISGTSSVCLGATSTLSSLSTGGTWVSANTAIATIGSSTGVVYGNGVGTSTVTYTLSTGCWSTGAVTVTPLPSTISGAGIVCIGGMVSVSSSTPGGTWSSSNTSIITVGSTSGLVNGVGIGAANLTYTLLSTGCYTVKSFSVNPLPSANTGTMSVCVGAVTTLSNASGGSWTTGTSAVAIVGSSSGVVFGKSAGTASITYTSSLGCSAVSTVTVMMVPVAITGTTSMCQFAGTTLSNSTTGGAWTSTDISVATIGSSSGSVSSISPGTSTISYTLSSGCSSTTVVTVNPLPTSISGFSKVCAGQTISLTDATPGGSWTSSNTSVADVGSGSGIVLGNGAGTATITYGLSTGCNATFVVTVIASPSPITGATGVCVTVTTPLSSSTSGGLWSSSTPGVATITSLGSLTGVSAGTTTVTYKVISTGCYTTAVINVSNAPGPITGSLNMCVGSFSALSNSALGGTWISSNTAVATVGYTSGIASGLTMGTSRITYSLGGSCTSMATATVTAALPSISGTAVVCENMVTGLSNSVSGGSWVSSNTSVATIGSSSGLLSGVVSGTSSITYTSPSGCSVSKTVTVNPAPSAILGIADVCAGGGTVTLSDATPGGTWYSSSGSIATIGSTSALVSGVTAGTTLISYKLTSTGCITTSVLTVIPLPSAILGNASVCPGGTTTLSDAGGGTWISGSVSIATIGSSSGFVNALASGTSVITYTLNTGCAITRVLTVNPLPGPITGPTAVCIGANITLVDGGGGTWLSSNTSVITIGSSSGIVTGGSTLGTSVVTYTLPTGCVTTTTVSVSPSPSAISGPSTVCAGATAYLSNSVSGGGWTSSNPLIAVVGTMGDVNGLGAGTVTITYSLGSGCTVMKAMTVNPAPSAILGPTTVCTGSLTTLSDATTGGVWSSSDPSVASITSGGTLSAASVGTTTITYGLTCNVTQVISVKPTPTTISGTPSVCAGDVTTLSNGVTGGTWTSSNTSVASVGSSSGIVNGLAAGTSSILYSMGAGCTTSKIVTVNPVANLTGSSNICVGLNTTLSSSISGGTWSSSDPSVATVTGGVVHGASAGTATISYIPASGCVATRLITVNTVPAPITGSSQICLSNTTPLSTTTSGGAWSSSNPGVVTVGSGSGIANGAGLGTAIISYSLGSGCTVTLPVTVNPMPLGITGGSSVCLGATIALSDATAGGIWSSANTVMATVSSGIVSALGAGTVTISYTLSSGCGVTKNITVNAPPAPITGILQVCAGNKTALSNAGTGTWSSSTPAKATVSGTGLVSGISAGTATISFSSGSGCSALAVVTVYPVPAAITGANTLCVTSATTLSDATPGGAWTTGDPSIATVSGGVVSGVSTGSVDISYSTGAGCTVSKTLTVNALPPAIIGGTNVCKGATVPLSEPSPGIWTTSNPIVASVGVGTGLLKGLSVGTATVTYSAGPGCIATLDINVDPTPLPITGTAHACDGQSTTLTDATTGGFWSSDDMSVATIDAFGNVNGLSSGYTTISYTLGFCAATTTMTIDPLPAAITGTASVCVGLPTVVSSATPGGVWSSSSLGTVVIGSMTGIATGITAGTATLMYTLPTGCSTSAVVTINPVPATITGPGDLCTGLSIALNDITGGGSWSSSNLVAASVDAFGNVSGLATGITDIRYTLSTGCYAAHSVTVNPSPAPITGVIDMCAGGTTHVVYDATTGGKWTSTLVTVDSLGMVTAQKTGVGIISYTLPTGCMTTATMTVLKVPGLVAGPKWGCTGAAITLTDTTLGGAWTSDDLSIANAYPGGIITGIAPGTVVISYTLPTGCGIGDTITIYASPAAIIGSSQICLGGVSTLSDASPAGSWSSDAPSIATVDMVTGDVTAMLVGNTTITYTNGVGCIATLPITVAPLPDLYSVTGGGTVCVGDPGKNVMLNSSAVGFDYSLYSGSTLIATRPGTGSGLTYGPYTASGIYTVLATNTTTSCTNTMSGSATIILTPLIAPVVTINTTPGSAVCAGTPVSFTAVPTWGGSAPAYQWKLNGIDMGISGPVYSYTPAEGDVVVAVMTSNATCASPTMAYSFVTMSVATPLDPSVTVTVDPGVNVAKGQPVTFTANVTDGGSAPVYQWTLNGHNITGATNATYVTTTLVSGDKVNCIVNTADMCNVTAKAPQDVYLSVSTTGTAIVNKSPSMIQVLPNPNKGQFSITGSISVTDDEKVTIEIADVLGQILYSGSVLAHGGALNEQVILPNTVANGMYLLSIRSSVEHRVFHVVVEQ